MDHKEKQIKSRLNWFPLAVAVRGIVDDIYCLHPLGVMVHTACSVSVSVAAPVSVKVSVWTNV